MVVLEFKLNQKDLTLVGNSYEIKAWNISTLRFTVRLNGAPGAVGWGPALCREDRRCSAGGQAMVGTEVTRREEVSMLVGNPPLRKDHRIRLPLTEHVGWESCELGQGGCQDQSARGSVMVPQTEAWAAQSWPPSVYLAQPRGVRDWELTDPPRAARRTRLITGPSFSSAPGPGIPSHKALRVKCIHCENARVPLHPGHAGTCLGLECLVTLLELT